MFILVLLRNQRDEYRLACVKDIDHYIKDLKSFGDPDSWVMTRKYTICSLTLGRKIASLVNTTHREFIPVLILASHLPEGLVNLCLNDMNFKTQK